MRVFMSMYIVLCIPVVPPVFILSTSNHLHRIARIVKLRRYCAADAYGIKLIIAPRRIEQASCEHNNSWPERRRGDI